MATVQPFLYFADIRAGAMNYFMCLLILKGNFDHKIFVQVSAYAVELLVPKLCRSFYIPFYFDLPK